MSEQRVKAASYPTIMVGSVGDIRMSPPEHLMYREAIEGNDEISVRRRTHLQRYFTQFCESDDYHRRLNDEQFKREGKFPDGRSGNATNAVVWTFKAWQWRGVRVDFAHSGEALLRRSKGRSEQKTKQGKQ